MLIMAIDTRGKRASVLGLTLPFAMHMPIPDGTIADADRQHISWLYAGIATAVAAAADAARRLAGRVFPFRIHAGQTGLFAGRTNDA